MSRTVIQPWFFFGSLVEVFCLNLIHWMLKMMHLGHSTACEMGVFQVHEVPWNLRHCRYVDVHMIQVDIHGYTGGIRYETTAHRPWWWLLFNQSCVKTIEYQSTSCLKNYECRCHQYDSNMRQFDNDHEMQIWSNMSLWWGRQKTHQNHEVSDFFFSTSKVKKGTEKWNNSCKSFSLQNRSTTSLYNSSLEAWPSGEFRQLLLFEAPDELALQVANGDHCQSC